MLCNSNHELLYYLPKLLFEEKKLKALSIAVEYKEPPAQNII